MIINNLKIAWRSLKKQPFFTFLNTFGLAIGMAGGLLISLYIYDELSYDKVFADADRIYRVDVDIKFGGEAQAFAEVGAPVVRQPVAVVVRTHSLGRSAFPHIKVDHLNVRELVSC